jgi:hypothetical protein
MAQRVLDQDQFHDKGPGAYENLGSRLSLKARMAFGELAPDLVVLICFPPGVHHSARRRGSSVAAGGAGAARADAAHRHAQWAALAGGPHERGNMRYRRACGGNK